MAPERRGRGRGAGRYPPLADYGLISDCRAAALVSRHGSIDWCCIPRFDSGSCFGRLLDWEHGGHCTIAPPADVESCFQRYEPDTLVLVTTFRTRDGEVQVTDLLAMPTARRPDAPRMLVRIAAVTRGHATLAVSVVPRFDYGAVRPWIRNRGDNLFTVTGGNDGLVVWSDAELAIGDDHDLQARLDLREGDRVRLSLESAAPADLDRDRLPAPDAAAIDRALRHTARWWRTWSRSTELASAEGEGVRRSAIVLKALSYAPTGAIVGAPTTSLPERIGGAANWDYRYSWIRDSTFAARSLAELGHVREADEFRRFVQRSAAGHAGDLQVVYGPGGERRLVEHELDSLEGYARSRPARVGNSAARQLQLDAYGELVNLFWRWHRRGRSPDDDDWAFIVDLVETAVERWGDPDCGIWEVRGRRRHFVHSKVLCWSAVDRGLALARECMRKAPLRRWRRARSEIREAVETRGYDRRRGVFVQAFGTRALDAAVLLLPTLEFCAWDDERMVRTADAIRAELSQHGLVYRYPQPSREREGAFLACSFWLAEAFARQGRIDEAHEVFDQAIGGANELGLMSEELDPRSGRLLGNFPQGLSHLSHIAAAIALAEADGAP